MSMKRTQGRLHLAVDGLHTGGELRVVPGLAEEPHVGAELLPVVHHGDGRVRKRGGDEEVEKRRRGLSEEV